jgi:hypothetical protein
VVETGQGDEREAAVDHAGLRTLDDGGEIEDARVGQMQRRDEGAAGAVCWQRGQFAGRSTTSFRSSSASSSLDLCSILSNPSSVFPVSLFLDQRNRRIT